MSPHIIGSGLFFGNSGDLWRHNGEGIGLPPSSSRFGHICARFNRPKYRRKFECHIASYTYFEMGFFSVLVEGASLFTVSVLTEGVITAL